MADKCIESGYMYEFAGKRRWRSSKDENWATVARPATCGRVVGTRMIDGTRVMVVKSAGGQYFAAKPTNLNGEGGGGQSG